jgi:hypothetical protein
MNKDSLDPLNKIEMILKKFILWIEILLAVFIIITILISIKDVVVLIYGIFITEANASYTVLQGLLSHILLLAVGLELAIMLITHTPGSVLEVILYAIARKMLLNSSNSTAMLLGVISIAIVFAVDKYLHMESMHKKS